MKRTVTLLSVFLACALHAVEPAPLQALPFDRDIISRLSLDGKPRSLAIRQGVDVWLGYDLERATVFKAWQSPQGKPGLIKTEFVTKSAGTTWFIDATDAHWELRRGDKVVPLKVRYLGCSHRADHVELRWELRHDAGMLKLHERISLAAAQAGERVVRALRVDALPPGETLLPPLAMRDVWKLIPHPAPGPLVLAGSDWHRITLP